jgi:hypothetical protein
VKFVHVATFSIAEIGSWQFKVILTYEFTCHYMCSALVNMVMSSFKISSDWS